MNRRAYMLIAVLVLGFGAMGYFLVVRNELPATELKSAVLFGVLLVGIAIFALRRERSGAPSGRVGWSKILLGSFALAFASWMLVSVLLLPLIGYSGFELMEKPWFALAFLFLALALVPVTRRFMK